MPSYEVYEVIDPKAVKRVGSVTVECKQGKRYSYTKCSDLPNPLWQAVTHKMMESPKEEIAMRVGIWQSGLEVRIWKSWFEARGGERQRNTIYDYGDGLNPKS